MGPRGPPRSVSAGREPRRSVARRQVQRGHTSTSTGWRERRTTRPPPSPGRSEPASWRAGQAGRRFADRRPTRGGGTPPRCRRPRPRPATPRHGCTGRRRRTPRCRPGTRRYAGLPLPRSTPLPSGRSSSGPTPDPLLRSYPALFLCGDELAVDRPPHRGGQLRMGKASDYLLEEAADQQPGRPVRRQIRGSPGSRADPRRAGRPTRRGRRSRHCTGSRGWGPSSPSPHRRAPGCGWSRRPRSWRRRARSSPSR